MGKGKPQARINTLTRCLLLSMAVTAGSMVPLTGACAQSQQPAAHAVQFDIPAGELVTALDRFAEQSGLQVVSNQSLQRIETPALQGSFTPEEALGRLLQGSGYTYQRLNAQTFVLKKRPSPPRSGRETGEIPPAIPQSTEPEVQNLGNVTVTGTRIRGGSTPSPVITIGAENIQEEGFTDLGDVIRSIPQNFTGGQNPGAGAGNIAGAGDSQQNMTGGSALNLRGLGADATLTLLNGRRLAYGGFTQGVDISAIPIAAVDRLEIVADGASAIYGSDAVGGVANVILKRDFDGLMVSARRGDSSDGGLDTHEYGVIGGKTWAGGGLLATYKDVSTHPIYTQQRDYTRQMDDPSTLYPGSDLKSALISGYQALGDRVEVRLDAFRTEREQLQYYTYAGYFTTAASETTSSLVSPSIEIQLPADWTLTVGGVWGKDEHHLDALQSNPDTGIEYSADLCYCNESTSYEVGAEGPLFQLPGGDARLAAGVGRRKNAFYAHDYATGANTMDGEQSAKFAYAEIDLPLVGADQGIAGMHRLALTAALRGEKYDSFGGVTTPKLGLVYSPNADLTLKVSSGRSFKAPTLHQQHYAESVYLYPASTLGGTRYSADATAMYRYGGNANLGPERADTWSTSLAFHPEALPGLEAELSAFHIDFTDRVMQAISGNGYAESLSNPLYADFVQYAPTAERQAEVIASTPNFYDLTGAGYDPSRVVAIVEGRYVNVARQEVRGIDLSGSYRFDLGAGWLTLRGSVSWLDSTRQNGDQGATYDLAGTLFNPPKRSSRLGAVFSHGGFSASLFGNYKDGVTNTVDGRKSASFTTFDTTLRYATADGDTSWSGLEFAISADNLFNRAPPLYVVAMPLNIPSFDQTNYSAIGRYLSLSVSKRW